MEIVSIDNQAKEKICILILLELKEHQEIVFTHQETFQHHLGTLVLPENKPRNSSQCKIDASPPAEQPERRACSTINNV